jgi:hypothetical protein
MKKSILEKYNLLLEGKYSREQFKKDVSYELPQYVTPVNTFNDVLKILKNKGIINENQISSEILGWFVKNYPNYNVKFKDFGSKKTVLSFENYKELPVNVYEELEEKYDIYEEDNADELTGYNKYEYILEPKEAVSNDFSYDKTSGEQKFNSITSPSIINGGRLNENKLKKSKLLTPDDVNYYEYQRGLRYETEKGKKPEKAQKDVLKNLAKDPIYYNRLLAGEKLVKNRDDQFIDISKSTKPKDLKDTKHDVEKIKGKFTIKDNVKDTLGKKESPKSSPKLKQQTFTPKKQRGIKTFEVPKTKEKKVTLKENVEDYKLLKLKHQIKNLIFECMCEMGMEEAVHVDPFDPKIPGAKEILTPFAEEVKNFLESVSPDEVFNFHNFGDPSHSYEDMVAMSYGYWDSLPENLIDLISQKYNIEEDNDASPNRFIYYITSK